MRAYFARAEHLLLHPEELLSILGQALSKAYAKRLLLFRVFEDLMLLFRFVRAWARGEYANVPRKSIFWALVAILYFLSPIDIFPDLLPGGYFDDVAVIAFIVKKIRQDLEGFEAWEKAKKA